MTRLFPRSSALAIILAAPALALASGFTGGRDADTKFHQEKNPKTYVKFESTAPKETIKGVTKEVTGDITINPAKMDKAGGTFTVPIKKIEVSNPAVNAKMADHMGSSDWLDAASNPEIVFTVSGIEGAELNKKKAITAKLTGKMKLHGVEKDVSIPVTMTYVKDTRKDSNKDSLAITAKFDVKLADYEIKGKRGSIGTSVAGTIKINVSLMMKSGDPEDKTAAAKPKPKPKAIAN